MRENLVLKIEISSYKQLNHVSDQSYQVGSAKAKIELNRAVVGFLFLNEQNCYGCLSFNTTFRQFLLYQQI